MSGAVETHRHAASDLAAGRQAGARRRCWWTWPGSNASITSAGLISATPTRWSASAPAATAARRCAARSPKPTSWPSPRPSATTGAATASTARCTWARTPTRCPARPSAPRWRCWRPTASRPIIQRDDGVTPTPVISRAILVYNRGRRAHLADGIVITPSHNPPEDGGFKYNPPNGGPADTDVTQWIQDRANELLRGGQRRREARAVRHGASRRRPRTQEDFVAALRQRSARTSSTWRPSAAAGLKLGVDPLGGAALPLLGADQRHLRAGHHRRQPEASTRPSPS